MEYRWYRNSRFYVESDDIERTKISHKGLTKDYFDDHIATRRNHDNYLSLCDSDVTSLGELEVISYYLDLRRSKVTSLGNLKWVGGHLYLRETNITDLGNLRYVSGRIFCDKGSVIHELLMDSKFRDQVWS